MRHEFNYTGKCYVLLSSTSQNRNRKQYDPILKDRFNFIYRPETGLSLVDQICYRPYVQSVITESPWIISCYTREEVYVWDSTINDWEHPDIETYGSDISNILHGLLKIPAMLPMIALAGVKGIKKLRKELGC